MSIQSKLICVISSLLLFSCSEQTSYTRKDCIVRIDIDSPLTQQAREKAISTATDAIYSSPDKTYKGSFPSLAINQTRDSIYMQFASECEAKYQMAKELVQLRMQPASIDSFQLTVSSDIVLPSTETIWVKGDAWLD